MFYKLVMNCRRTNEEEEDGESTGFDVGVLFYFILVFKEHEWIKKKYLVNGASSYYPHLVCFVS